MYKRNLKNTKDKNTKDLKKTKDKIQKILINKSKKY